MNSPDCLLTCGHWKRIRLDNAVIGSIVDCAFDGPSTIVSVRQYEWHARCQSCRFSRWLGQDQRECERAAARHQQRYQSHQLSVAYDRITWDGGGTLLRRNGERVVRRRPRTVTAKVSEKKFGSGLDSEPPF